MTGYIDIVCNIHTPEAVANGWTGLDDDFKRQVRMPPECTDSYGNHKVRFGTDWPVIDPERAVAEVAEPGCARRAMRR